ncbi:helix-turn-helix domain-containing protein [Anaeromyxobacter oryzisoli]|uniref:helix-turn-helix domain-containing protein n=1 Tax=Anaeromyxobacter oryzisoli TaxID=2925408 RepID=UPI0038CBFE30
MKREQKPLIEVLGPRVRELRKRHGLSQEELARRAEMDRADLSRLETSAGPRNFGVERLEKLARALGIPVADLFPRS